MTDKSKNIAGARILIREDEITLPKDIARTLKSLGYEVVGMVSTGEEAIREAHEASP